MKDIAKTYFSMGMHITQTKDLVKISTEAFLDLLVSSKLRDDCKYIRSLPNKADRKKVKAQRLPYVCFAGVFNTRNKKELVTPSGLMCLDIDEYDHNKIKTIKANVSLLDSVVCVFYSPSGGLKILVRIPKVTTDKEYKEYFYGFVNKHKDYDFDLSGSDICRATYLSYDQDFWFVPNAEPFTEKGNYTYKKSTNSIKMSCKGVDNSPSGATFGFICTLLRDGKSKQDIFRILDSMPRMRWSDRTQDWKELTYDKARGNI